jgi:hypothetical protein
MHLAPALADEVRHGLQRLPLHSARLPGNVERGREGGRGRERERERKREIYVKYALTSRKCARTHEHTHHKNFSPDILRPFPRQRTFYSALSSAGWTEHVLAQHGQDEVRAVQARQSISSRTRTQTAGILQHPQRQRIYYSISETADILP